MIRGLVPASSSSVSQSCEPDCTEYRNILCTIQCLAVCTYTGGVQVKVIDWRCHILVERDSGHRAGRRRARHASASHDERVSRKTPSSCAASTPRTSLSCTRQGTWRCELALRPLDSMASAAEALSCNSARNLAP